jgi:hypothetical protein
MSTQHTQARLRAGPNGGYGLGPVNAIFTAESDISGELIASLATSPPNPNVEADARRLAACWNACDGISTEDLEQYYGHQGGVDAALHEASLRDQVNAVAQRDELLAALLKAEAALADIGDADREPGDDIAWCEARAAEALPVVRAAIAKAEGGRRCGMTKDQIIQMAQQCSILGHYDELVGPQWRQDTIRELTRFANLVEAAARADERERVAKLEAAINKLHTAKGRYHTQLAICDLFDLVGLPNERPKK